MGRGMDLQSRCRSKLTHEQIGEIFARIQTFDYNNIRIRVIENSGQKWMVFADVCKALGYKNPNHQSKYLTAKEKCRLDIGLKNTLTICVSEPGLRFFTLLANMNGQLTLMKSAWDALKTTIGEQFIPEMRTLYEVGTDVFSGIVLVLPDISESISDSLPPWKQMK